MCKRLPEDTIYSYFFRQVCEKSWAVLAISGFAVLVWYSEKVESTQKGIIERAAANQATIARLMQDTLEAQHEQTRAIIVLTNKIDELSRRVERVEEINDVKK